MNPAPFHLRRPNRETRDNLHRIMPSQTSAPLPLSDFTLALAALLLATAVSCAGTVTPPDSTPVYADSIGDGVKRVEIEHQSTNRPTPEKVSPGKEATAPPDPEATPKVEADVPSQPEATPLPSAEATSN